MPLIDEVLVYLYTEFCFNITNKGTKYLAESIVAVYRDRNKALHLTNLYKDIAKKNNTTWQAVERIMRNEVKKVSDNKLGEFILRQAIIIKQKRKRGQKNEFCKETQQGKKV